MTDDQEFRGAVARLQEIDHVVRGLDPAIRREAFDALRGYVTPARRQIDWASLGDLSSGDIEAMAFLVLMEAAKSAQEDIRDVMEQVKAINVEKEGYRERLQQVQQVAGKLESSQRDELREALDCLAKLSEAESLRLQMAMDRLSKLLSTLSNLLKKASETAADITQNIK
jgi:hypothetical protein